MKINTQKKLLLAVITSACLSGCNLLPTELLGTEKPSNISASTVSSFQADTALNKNAPKNSRVTDNQQQANIELLIQSVNEYKKDYESIRPALVRLVELEGDLSFLLSTLEQTASIPSYESVEEIELTRRFASEQVSENSAMLDTPDGDEFEPAPSPIFEQSKTRTFDVVEKFGVNTDESGKAIYANAVNTVIDNKFSTRATKRNQIQATDESNKNLKTPVALPAQEIMAVAPKRAPTVSNQAVASGDASKFSSAKAISGLNLKETVNSCKTRSAGTYAVHLASYSSTANAKSAWTQFEKKASDIICGESPRVKEVIVNDATFQSLRIGPFLTKAEALKKCTQIKRVQSYCSVSTFEGQPFL